MKRKFGFGLTTALHNWWLESVSAPVLNSLGSFFGPIVLVIPLVLYGITAFILLFVDLIGAIGNAIADLFNASDDDEARAFINQNRNNPAALTGLTDNQLVQMINAMLDGPTGDDDENAILILLGALDCSRMTRIVNRVGLSNLQSDIDGPQYDELMILLGNCRIVRFDQWDDDASRLFVNRLSQIEINSLELSEIRQLILNMFRGSCGDDDENAINRIMNFLTRERLHSLIRMPGMSVSEFDDNVDGAEWRTLRTIFNRNGIAA
jgi:hypothetical protein